MSATILKPRRIHGYGYVPDLADARDLRALSAPLATRPKRVDLTERGFLGAPFNQGNLGSCTANAIGKAYRHALGLSGKGPYDLSRLFVYYGEREIEGSIGIDAGAMIRDGMKVIAKLGAPPETEWPYNIARFATRAPASVYDDALKHQCLKYSRVAVALHTMLDTLARGLPIVAGFTAYESFESDEAARTGRVANPRKGEAVLGGHAVLLVGYEQATARTYTLKWLNSWGSTWGAGGYFFTKSSFITATQVSDCWVAEATE